MLTEKQKENLLDPALFTGISQEARFRIITHLPATSPYTGVFTEKALHDGLRYLLDHHRNLKPYQYHQPLSDTHTKILHHYHYYDPFFYPFALYSPPSCSQSQAACENKHENKSEHQKAIILYVLVCMSTLCWYFTAKNILAIWKNKEPTETKTLKIATLLLTFSIVIASISIPLIVTSSCSIGLALGIAVLIGSIVTTLISSLLKTENIPSLEILKALRPIQSLLEKEAEQPEQDGFGAPLDNPDTHKAFVREVVKYALSNLAQPTQNFEEASRNNPYPTSFFKTAQDEYTQQPAYHWGYGH